MMHGQQNVKSVNVIGMYLADVLPLANAVCMYGAFIIRYYKTADRMFSVYRPSRKQWTCYFPVTGLENRYLKFVSVKQIQGALLNRAVLFSESRTFVFNLLNGLN
jgi:hypothetical protein